MLPKICLELAKGRTLLREVVEDADDLAELTPERVARAIRRSLRFNHARARF